MGGGVVSGMSITQLTSGFTDLGTIVASSFSTLTGNPVLLACFAAGILGVGFRVIHMARNF